MKMRKYKIKSYYKSIVRYKNNLFNKKKNINNNNKILRGKIKIKKYN